MYVKVIVNYSKSIILEFMAKNSYEITHDLITTLFIVLFRKAVVETWVIVQVVLPFFFFFLKGKCYGIKTKKEDIQRFLHEQARNKKLHHIRLQKRRYKGRRNSFPEVLVSRSLSILSKLVGH